MYLGNALVSSFNCLSSEELQAAERYFLTAFIYQFGIGEWAQTSLDRLAGKLGVSERLARHSIGVLVDQGLLDARRVEGRTGRPSYDYRLSKLVADRLNLQVGPVSVGHEGLVKSLLSIPSPGGLEVTRKKGRTFGPPNPDALSVGSKLVLIVLLTEADSCGVVRNCSTFGLAKQVGMSVQRVRRHLRKLWRLGYMRDVVAGIVSDIGIGKCPSIYFLNLAHPIFEASWCGRAFVLHIQKKDQYHPGREIPQLIRILSNGCEDDSYVAIEYDRRNYLLPVKCEDDVAKRLKDAVLDGLEEYLQAVLDDYVGQILTDRYLFIGSQFLPEPSINLRLEMEALLCVKERKGSDEAASRAAMFLSGWIWRAACMKSEVLSKKLGVMRLLMPPDGRISILRSTENGKLLILKALVAPPPGRNVTPGIYQGASIDYVKSTKEINRVDLSTKEQYEIGLLVKPSVKTKKEVVDTEVGIEDEG